MTPQPKVSLCIPVLNGMPYLEEALKSAINQTWCNLEIIISDDGSDDGSFELAGDMLSRSNLQYDIYRNEIRGISNNLNSLLHRSNGKYVKYLCQDDLLRPDCISELVAVAEIDEDIGLVFSKRKILNENTEDTACNHIQSGCVDLHRNWPKLRTVQSGVDLLNDSIKPKTPINKIGEPTTILLKKTAAINCSGFDENLAQLLDVHLWFRIMAGYKIGFVDKSLSTFRIHDAQKSTFNQRECINEEGLLYQMLLEDSTFRQAHLQPFLKGIKCLQNQSRIKKGNCPPHPETAVQVTNLCKSFHADRKHVSLLKKVFCKKEVHHGGNELFHALRGVSFKIQKGTSLGIIGLNGSGKSTLLQIIAGTLQPSSGFVQIRGRVAALLELGSGFNPDFNGRENVFLKASILGFPKKQIEEQFEKISNFADIGDFMDQPVRTYSSGMMMRLAFATQIILDPEILIIDEALAVGDIFFQAKCMARMREMMDRGVTLILVSHDPNAIKSLCQRCLLLENGEIVFDGDASEATERYFQSMNMVAGKSFPTSVNPASDHQGQNGQRDSGWDEFTQNNDDFNRTANFQRIENGKARFARVAMLDENGADSTMFRFGSVVTILMGIECLQDLPRLCFGYHVRDHNFSEIIYSDSEIEGENIVNPTKGSRYLLEWKFKATLRQGSYNLATVLSIPIDLNLGQVEFCDFVPLAAQFQMNRGESPMIYAPVHLENHLKIKKV